MLSFYNPWKHQKTFDFLVFSGGNKMKTLARNRLIDDQNWTIRRKKSKEITEEIFNRKLHFLYRECFKPDTVNDGKNVRAIAKKIIKC